MESKQKESSKFQSRDNWVRCKKENGSDRSLKRRGEPKNDREI